MTTPAVELAHMPLLEENTPCEHSNHGVIGWGHHHDGPATHYVHVLHECQADPAQGRVYPVCVRFAQYTVAMADQPWMCPKCHEVDDGERMVKVVASIKGSS